MATDQSVKTDKTRGYLGWEARGGEMSVVFRTKSSVERTYKGPQIDRLLGRLSIAGASTEALAREIFGDAPTF